MGQNMQVLGLITRIYIWKAKYGHLRRRASGDALKVYIYTRHKMSCPPEADKPVGLIVDGFAL